VRVLRRPRIDAGRVWQHSIGSTIQTACPRTEGSTQ
jgi:hypothetical protein